MPVKDLVRKSAKRKQIDDEETAPPQEELQSHGVLEMLSEDEDDGDASEDDGQLDEFPEIVTDSDSEEEDEGDGEDEEDASSDEEEEEDDEEDADSDASDESLHIFPKAKVIVSDITKQPKTVYPEIEPDYDSDSSTEDVGPLPVPVTQLLTSI